MTVAVAVPVVVTRSRWRTCHGAASRYAVPHRPRCLRHPARSTCRSRRRGEVPSDPQTYVVGRTGCLGRLHDLTKLVLYGRHVDRTGPIWPPDEISRVGPDDPDVTRRSLPPAPRRGRSAHAPGGTRSSTCRRLSRATPDPARTRHGTHRRLTEAHRRALGRRGRRHRPVDAPRRAIGRKPRERARTPGDVDDIRLRPTTGPADDRRDQAAPSTPAARQARAGDRQPGGAAATCRAGRSPSRDRTNDWRAPAPSGGRPGRPPRPSRSTGTPRRGAAFGAGITWCRRRHATGYPAPDGPDTDTASRQPARPADAASQRELRRRTRTADATARSDPPTYRRAASRRASRDRRRRSAAATGRRRRSPGAAAASSFDRSGPAPGGSDGPSEWITAPESVDPRGSMLMRQVTVVSRNGDAGRAGARLSLTIGQAAARRDPGRMGPGRRQEPLRVRFRAMPAICSRAESGTLTVIDAGPRTCGFGTSRCRAGYSAGRHRQHVRTDLAVAVDANDRSDRRSRPTSRRDSSTRC